MDLPEDFAPPSIPATTNEQFITLSLKLIRADTECCFRHWQEVDIPPGPYVITDEGDEQIHLYRMMKHLTNVMEGTRMVMDRIINNLGPETLKMLVVERAQEEHGVEFEATDIIVGGQVVGLALKAKDPESGVEEITEWLNKG